MSKKIPEWASTKNKFVAHSGRPFLHLLVHSGPRMNESSPEWTNPAQNERIQPRMNESSPEWTNPRISKLSKFVKLALFLSLFCIKNNVATKISVSAGSTIGDLQLSFAQYITDCVAHAAACPGLVRPIWPAYDGLRRAAGAYAAGHARTGAANDVASAPPPGANSINTWSFLRRVNFMPDVTVGGIKAPGCPLTY